MAELYGLIGFPLGHSFSAKYFAEKFASQNIDAEYRNFAIESIKNLPEILKNNSNLKGLNVTIPYKQQVMPFLDDIDEAAKRIGAVNVICVSRKGNQTKLTGHNADVIGFTESLRPLLKPQHTKALVLGTGGASKAVIDGLQQLGILTQYVSRTRREGIIAYDITPKKLSFCKKDANKGRQQRTVSRCFTYKPRLRGIFGTNNMKPSLCTIAGNC